MGISIDNWAHANAEKKIFLLRHGEIEKPREEKCFIGQIDLPLSPRGRAQAGFWRGQLAGIALSRIVCSDLSRCVETARIVAAENGAEVSTDAGLREIHLGQWDGMAFAEVQARWPDHFRERGRLIDGFRPPDGESFRDLQQRVASVFEKAVADTDGNLLMVTHAGVIRVLLCHLLGMPVSHLFRLDQDYAALNLIVRQSGGYRLHALNLTPDEER
ncbi:alpha-ribazole phosphatase [Desulfosarcina ovata subsp. sediminis]|uniref:Alpha-ribazole phosphatase n=1 Tax=Desulfosarcina ovata subsp. sediminis TaxID=885957 RepID=A0A5K8A299_9BACT|nr:alpha-ribazole phosphatase [Desulfosarcina ovata]BBO86390.1 alpha-ribazole phosphatase [Desulfosarcina ovata subsp. sediminis]